MKALISVFIIIFALPQTVFGLTFIEAEGLSRSPLSDNVYIFEDRDSSLKIEDIVKKDIKRDFFISDKASISLGFTSSTYWFYFSVHNKGPEEITLFLEIAYPLLNSIKLFSHNETISELYHTGTKFPFYERPYDHRNFILPITIRPGMNDFFLKCRTESSMDMPMTLWSYDAFHANERTELPVWWIYFGLLITMILYNFFIFIAVRDIKYLYYSLFILGSSAFQFSLSGLSFQYVWPNSHYWVMHNIPFFICFAIFWGTIFSRKYLNTKEIVIYWDKTAKALTGIYLSWMFIGLVIPYRISISIAAILSFIFVSSIFYIGFIYMTKKMKHTRFFILAWIAFFLGTLLVVLKTFGIMPGGFLSKWGFQAGITINVLFLSLGLADKVNFLLKELDSLNKSLEEKVILRTMEIKNYASALKNIMDNTGEGFLTFSDSLKVNYHYSLECEKIFKTKIDNKFFPKLLYPHNEKEEQFITRLLTKIFDATEEARSQTLFSLLPSEVFINNKYISLSFKKITHNRRDLIMVILVDITEKHNLETQMEVEKNNLRMIVKIISEHDTFFDIYKDFREFSSGLVYEIIMDEKKPLKNKISSIYRIIHTFKGSFSQFNMQNITTILHNLETRLSEFPEGGTKEDAIKLISDANLQEALSEDTEKIKQILGSDFFKRENIINVEKNRIKDIETRMSGIFASEELNIMLPEIKKIRYKDIKSLLRPYQDYVLMACEKFEKYVNPFTIEGPDIPVDPENYNGLIKSLVHIFRNCIDHGIEPPEERSSLKKPEYGNISCRVEHLENNLIIHIKDDGRGIDLEKIKEMVLKNNLLSKEDLNFLSDGEILDFIFKDDLTTKENATEFSGRGIGLSAVKSEVDKLNGKIIVSSKPGEGTEFILTVPYLEHSAFIHIKIKKLMYSFIKSLKKHLKTASNLNISAVSNPVSVNSESLDLKHLSASINVKNTNLAFEILFCADREILIELSKNYITENEIINDKDIILHEVLKEELNIVTGSTNGILQESNCLLIIEPPIIIPDASYIDQGRINNLWAFHISTLKGDINIYFLLHPTMSQGRL